MALLRASERILTLRYLSRCWTSSPVPVVQWPGCQWPTCDLGCRLQCPTGGVILSIQPLQADHQADHRLAQALHDKNKISERVTPNRGNRYTYRCGIWAKAKSQIACRVPSGEFGLQKSCGVEVLLLLYPHDRNTAKTITTIAAVITVTTTTTRIDITTITNTTTTAMTHDNACYPSDQHDQYHDRHHVRDHGHNIRMTCTS